MPSTTIYIGPSGNSNSFYASGLKRTVQAAKWVKNQGLNAFEYSLGKGIRLKPETVQDIADVFEEYGVKLSVHAPYFINLAVDDERVQKNFDYFLDTAQVAKDLRAERVIFHPGSCASIDRDKALDLALSLFAKILKRMDESGYEKLIFCPETMGKFNQLGDVNEIVELCNLDDRIIPTIDFGHLHARGLGALNTKEDFEAVLDELQKGIGWERTRRMHVHFSRIEFTGKGEKKHHTFADKQYGPDFEPFAKVVVERDLRPHILCESNGTQMEDALYMKEILKKLNANGI